jgi:carbamoyltransferase
VRICGVKTTHDGGVALIDDGRLIFSYEMEKLDNNERYSKIGDLAFVFELLEDHGYRVEDIDRFVLDGWYKTHKVRPWHGQEVEIVLAPYRRGLTSSDLFHRFSYRAFDLEYDSYTHYAGHVASGYCTSPYAKRGAGSFVLSWDGWMFPFLYYVDAAGTTETVGALMPLIGDAYYRLSRHFPPFDIPLEFPHVLGLAGKIMAYIAVGKPQESVIEHLDSALEVLASEEIGTRWRTEDLYLQTDVGVRILSRMEEIVAVDNNVNPDDMLASIHEFLQRKLLAGLRSRLESFGPKADRNLCIVGGCGLNIKWNSVIRDSGIFDSVWVPPFPNDAGSAIGTASVAMLTRTESRSLDWNVYSGPPLLDNGILPGWSTRPCTVAELARVLHESGKPVVFLHGRAELGPRALGNRSILAPAVAADMKDVLNDVKEREWYRPIAPICLEQHAQEIFDPGAPDPYMIFDHRVRDDWKDRVPAICHLDGTARLQTVNEDQNPTVFELLSAYKALSGVPLLCNTSANFKGSGFFPDVRSAMEWGRCRMIWSNGVLYTCDGDRGMA